MKVNEEYIYGNNYSQLGLATSDENLLLNRKNIVIGSIQKICYQSF